MSRDADPLAAPRSSARDPDSFGPRPGEVAIELPESFDAGLHFIGRLRTPWSERSGCPKNGNESEALCRVEVDAPYRPGLADLAGTSHVWVLYWMDRAPRNLVVQTPRVHGTGRGTFALRSPARPNPIALSAVRVVALDADGLSVVGLDCLDGTPLLDIKPYFASTDSRPDAVVGWRERVGRERT